MFHNGQPPHKHAVNGSLINAFEYYIGIKRFNKDFKLVLINFSPAYIDFLTKVFSQRANNISFDWKSDIISLTRPKAMFKRYDRVLILDYGTMRDMKGKVIAKEITIISEKNTDKEEYFWDPCKYRAKYFAEMPFEYGESYRMKFLFDHYPQIESSNERVFVSSPEFTWYNDSNFLLKIKEIRGRDYFLKHSGSIDDLFSKYDTFVYYKSPRVWDCHPRLMIESAFYNKEYWYYNDTDIKDGSYYRYMDLIQNGILDRNMEKDKVIERLI